MSVKKKVDLIYAVTSIVGRNVDRGIATDLADLAQRIQQLYPHENSAKIAAIIAEAVIATGAKIA